MRKYSEEQRDRGMLALIMTSGNERAASKALAQEGETIPHQTLGAWKKKHCGRYEELEHSYGPRIRDTLALQCESLAMAYSALERAALTRGADTLDQLEARDVPGAARNYATGKAIAIDKAALLRGLPTAITESRNPDQLLNGMAVKLGIVVKGS